MMNSTSDEPVTNLVTRDLLLTRDNRRYTEIPFGDTGLMLRIRSLTELERSRYEASLMTAKGRLKGDALVKIKARLIAETAVDADGNLLLTEKDVTDLMHRDSRLINSLVDPIKEHVGINDGDLEDLEKNYGTIPDVNSP